MRRLVDNLLHNDAKGRRGAENGLCSCEIGINLSAIVEIMKTRVLIVKTLVFKAKKIVARTSTLVIAFAKTGGVPWKSS